MKKKEGKGEMDHRPLDEIWEPSISLLQEHRENQLYIDAMSSIHRNLTQCVFQPANECVAVVSTMNFIWKVSD